MKLVTNSISNTLICDNIVKSNNIYINGDGMISDIYNWFIIIIENVLEYKNAFTNLKNEPCEFNQARFNIAYEKISANKDEFFAELLMSADNKMKLHKGFLRLHNEKVDLDNALEIIDKYYNYLDTYVRDIITNNKKEYFYDVLASLIVIDTVFLRLKNETLKIL